MVCLSTILPDDDFYYPGRLYEGVQLFIDLNELTTSHKTDLFSELGMDLQQLATTYCRRSGLYLHTMNDAIRALTSQIWGSQETASLGKLRYLVLSLLHELAELPLTQDLPTYYTRSQIAIVKEAESMILSDLSKKITARELADHFGISESSFKAYVKGILGDTYLSYFRKKRMKRAAELLATTDLKVIDISNAVGYENQGKFARVFADLYGIPPLEYRRTRKQT